MSTVHCLLSTVFRLFTVQYSLDSLFTQHCTVFTVESVYTLNCMIFAVHMYSGCLHYGIHWVLILWYEMGAYTMVFTGCLHYGIHWVLTLWYSMYSVFTPCTVHFSLYSMLTLWNASHLLLQCTLNLWLLQWSWEKGLCILCTL